MNLSPSFTLTIIHFPFQKDFSSSLACDFLKPEKKLYHNMKWANLIFAPFIFIVSFSMAFAGDSGENEKNGKDKAPEPSASESAPPSPSSSASNLVVSPKILSPSSSVNSSPRNLHPQSSNIMGEEESLSQSHHITGGAGEEEQLPAVPHLIEDEPKIPKEEGEHELGGLLQRRGMVPISPIKTKELSAPKLGRGGPSRGNRNEKHDISPSSSDVDPDERETFLKDSMDTPDLIKSLSKSNPSSPKEIVGGQEEAKRSPHPKIDEGASVVMAGGEESPIPSSPHGTSPRGSPPKGSPKVGGGDPSAGGNISEDDEGSLMSSGSNVDLDEEEAKLNNGPSLPREVEDQQQEAERKLSQPPVDEEASVVMAGGEESPAPSSPHGSPPKGSHPPPSHHQVDSPTGSATNREHLPIGGDRDGLERTSSNGSSNNKPEDTLSRQSSASSVSSHNSIGKQSSIHFEGEEVPSLPVNELPPPSQTGHTGNRDIIDLEEKVDHGSGSHKADEEKEKMKKQHDHDLKKTPTLSASGIEEEPGHNFPGEISSVVVSPKNSVRSPHNRDPPSEGKSHLSPTGGGAKTFENLVGGDKGVDNGKIAAAHHGHQKQTHQAPLSFRQKVQQHLSGAGQALGRVLTSIHTHGKHLYDATKKRVWGREQNSAHHGVAEHGNLQGAKRHVGSGVGHFGGK